MLQWCQCEDPKCLVHDGIAHCYNFADVLMTESREPTWWDRWIGGKEPSSEPRCEGCAQHAIDLGSLRQVRSLRE
jgi:hypothetical protein